MQQYLHTMRRVLNEGGEIRPDRTGVGRLSIFTAQEVYDISGNTVPLSTTSRVHMQPLLKELFGMIGGFNSVDKLGEKFWGQWAPDENFLKNTLLNTVRELPEDQRPPQAVLDQQLANLKNSNMIGSIGPMYGALWRQWPLTGGVGDFTWIKGIEDIASDRYRQLSIEFDRQLVLSNGQIENTQENRDQFIGDQYVRSIDQLNRVMKQLKRDPYSSHHRVTAFDPSLVGPHADPRENVLEGFGALSPCHTFYQFHVSNENRARPSLSCHLYMGSSDVCLGRRYNIPFYSLLTIMMAHCLDYDPKQFIITSGDTHIYANHIDKAKEQVKLTPSNNKTVVKVNPAKTDLFAMTADDLEFIGYEYQADFKYKANV